VIVERGKPADQIFLIAHGKLNKIGVGKYGDETVLGVLIDGDHFTYRAVVESGDTWDFTVKAVTSGTLLVLSQQVFEEIVAQSKALQAHIARFKASSQRPRMGRPPSPWPPDTEASPSCRPPSSTMRPSPASTS
jgi:CRP-like cAMP-binding protein